MKTIHTRARVGSDGIMELRLPSGVIEADLDVIIVIRTIAERGSDQRPKMTPEVWKQWIEQTAGSWKGEPLERAPQGEFEIRESFE